MIRKLDLLFWLCLVGVFDVESHGVSVMVGDSVTLDSNASEIEQKNEIEWRFNDIRIANVIMGNPTYHDYSRFKDRLKLDRNGSLTIKDTRITDTGVYKLSTIISNRESIKRFSVTVYAPLSIPVVTSDISQCSSGSKCSLLCSVVNVSDVTLSWYKGNSLLSSISVSDLSISLSLPLEVEYQDKNTYSCVLNNPISNQTKHVCITDLCRLCSVPSSDEVHYGGGTEAVIRLVVTALVGLAAVAAFIVLVYDIRSRRVEQETHR
ncbi:contactin-3-like [Sinocyclocheilus anshuiensis]|uniref:Contactin-3-like n=1 Tax=Sinocyclocheilus anshuiensis TaxID=1608454 RepID=A0A671KFU2_9TELE|nr:PREDICTED: contactin-3-like [Sinocyclocheilus anshuiensis]